MSKHALIIGATGGIGQATARKLQGQYDLTLVGRDQEKLRALKSLGTVIPTDVSSELEVNALFEELPTIDVLIYAVGDIQPELIKMANSDAFHRVIEANLTGVFYTLRYAVPKLNKDARVFVLGARPELISYRGFSVYAAAKAGAKALVDIANIELARSASFTLVLPKAVDTEFWNNVGKAPKDALSPNDVAEAISSSLQGEPVNELLVG